uniref:Uncharacterized protein n=1 Tax=Anguilla anguilla TaxID=7936 RepID=A0A0E9Q200_ANGAN
MLLRFMVSCRRSLFCEPKLAQCKGEGRLHGVMLFRAELGRRQSEEHSMSAAGEL